MTYKDDKSVTKMAGNVHAAVMLVGYTLSCNTVAREKGLILTYTQKEKVLMLAVRIITWVARIAWLGAIILGLLFWITGFDLIRLHILFGLVVGLSLLALGFMLLFTHGVRLLGIAGIVYAIILPLFGLTQATLLVGNLHWLIQAAHLLVGIGAIALVQLMSTRYERLQKRETLNRSRLAS
jgi:hypothetical protein